MEKKKKLFPYLVDYNIHRKPSETQIVHQEIMHPNFLDRLIHEVNIDWCTAESIGEHLAQLVTLRCAAFNESEDKAALWIKEAAESRGFEASC